MPFSESVKIQAKQRANYRCVVCHQPWVEVHHIHPEGQGGPNTIDNAAQLCGSCHTQYGGNPDLRKQLREMRDWWWQRCGVASHVVVDAGLAQRMDALQLSLAQGQKRQEEALAELKDMVIQQLNLAQQQVMAAGSLRDALAVTSGLASGLPPFGLDQEEPWVGQMQKAHWRAVAYHDDEVLPKAQDNNPDQP
jgi:formate-dependent nitrite reductase cytochrome c552 subunit